MAENRFDEEMAGGGDRLYADAVCAQCSTVNPEGSLICKTCGNNLRDQRSIRLAAELELEGVKTVDQRQLLFGVLTTLGILLVIYTAWNADSLMTWLVSAQSAANTPAALWTGPEGAAFNELLAALDASAPTADQIRTAMETHINSEAYDGVYVLADQDPGSAWRTLGTAIVRQDGESLLFAARLTESGEVRGRAHFQGNYLTAGWDTAGAFDGRAYIAVSGVAAKQPDGTFECYGRSEESESNFEFRGFRLP